MRGGARVNSGPAPDPDALRRDRPSDREGWRILPGPRSGKAPAWPLLPDVMLRAKQSVLADQIEMLEAALEDLEGRPRATAVKKLGELQEQIAVINFRIEAQTKTEQLVWRELWKSPQAHAWSELGWHRDVAQYVRHKVLGEMGSLDDAKEARQWSDRLGLNPAAMLRNRWRVATKDELTKTRTTRRTVANRTSARDRLQVVDGGKRD